MLLATNLVGVYSDHPHHRFISGESLPSVWNTYSAEISANPGEVTSVRFDLGGKSAVDTDGSDGWSMPFDMSRLNTAEDLLVTASGPGGTVFATLDVDTLLLPDWLLDEDTDVSVTHDWETGYEFDVTVTHLDMGFNTPSDWVFSIPGLSEPLFDLADMRTGFTVASEFQLTSEPNGLVRSSDFHFAVQAEILDAPIFERSLDYQYVGKPLEYEKQTPAANVGGRIEYGAEVAPHFNNQLILDGISGTAWVDPSLSISMPLGEARIPLLSFPGGLDVVVGARATVQFVTAPGHDHMIEISPRITNGGLGIDLLELNPAIEAAITGYGELEALLGAGTIGADITGTLTQGLTTRYDAISGWSQSAPGSLALSGTAYYKTLWDLGPSGSMDLFSVNVATWDFLKGQGDSVGASQIHQLESTVLVNPRVDGNTFFVDYVNPGTPPRDSRLVIDNQHDYRMTLLSGSPDNGTYLAIVNGLDSGSHESYSLFVDEDGQYHAVRSQAESSPAAPGNVQATDGSFTDKVVVSWASVPGASGYDVWRSIQNDPATAHKVFSTGTNTTSGADTGAESGVTYHYWVKAKKVTNGGVITSEFSNADTGYRKTVNNRPDINAFVVFPGSEVSPGSTLVLAVDASDQDGDVSHAYFVGSSGQLVGENGH